MCNSHVSVRLSQVGILPKRPKRADFWQEVFLIKNLGIFKITNIPLEISQNRDLKKFRHGTSTVAGVVNFLRLTTVPSLSHRTSIFVYSATAVRRAGPSAAADTFFWKGNQWMSMQHRMSSFVYPQVVLWAWNISNYIFQFVSFFLKYFKANKNKKNTNYIILFFVIYRFLYYFCETVWLQFSYYVTCFFFSRGINKWYIVGAYR